MQNYNKVQIPSILKSPIAVVCHDAGAANLICAWINHWNKLGLLENKHIRFLIKGPFENEWKKSFKFQGAAFYSDSDYNSLFIGVNSVLTGTGWSSSLEHDVRKYAKLFKIPCIAVIDHWVNYKERFERNSEIVLPDEIWVSDQYANEIANYQFPGIPIISLPNIYLSELIQNIQSIPEKCQTLLYLTEPLRTNWGRRTEGEFQALDYFVENKKIIIGNEPMDFVMRLHPSENIDKYSQWMKENSDINPKIDVHEDLKNSISNAKWVVGAETFALVVALAAKRSVWSSLPPWGNHCRLPQTSIKKIKDFVK
jgi:hypothetical protein